MSEHHGAALREAERKQRGFWARVDRLHGQAETTAVRIGTILVRVKRRLAG